MTAERPPNGAATASLGNARALRNRCCRGASPSACREAQTDLYPDALRTVTEGKVAIAPFVKTHPLSEITRVFDALHAHAFPYRPVLATDGR